MKRLLPYLLLTALSGPFLNAQSTIGTVPTQTYVFNASDSNGASDIASLYLLVTKTAVSSNLPTVAVPNACEIKINLPSPTAAIANNAGTFGSFFAIPSANFLSNSQCSVNLANVIVVSSGNSIAVTIPYTFATTFVGSLTAQFQTIQTTPFGTGTATAGNTYSGWNMGGIEVVPNATSAPSVFNSPASGSGTNTNGTIALIDKGGQDYNILAYGAVADDTTDNTTALTLAINTALAGGGGNVFIPTGTFKVNGCITPNYGLPFTQTNPLRIHGTSRQYTNNASGWPTNPSGGSILDMSCNNGTNGDGIGIDFSGASSTINNPTITGVTSTGCPVTGQSCTPLAVGQAISCQATIATVPTVITSPGTTVASFVANTSITLSSNALATATGLVGCNVGGNVGGKLTFLGSGAVEIDHLTFEETQSATNATPFLYFTQASPNVHDNSFFGHPSDTYFSATEDAVVLGGDVNVYAQPNGWAGTAADAFQGYKPTLERNFFQRIRRSLLARTYVNGLNFTDNFIGWQSGNNMTMAITAATNASPTVLTLAQNVGIPLGKTFKVLISGATGSWTPINGSFTATPITTNTFSIPVNSTAFGALTGSPVTPWGGVVEIRGSTPSAASNYAVGGMLTNNYVEGQGSAFSYLFNAVTSHIVLGGYDSVDGNGGMIAGIRFEGNSVNNVYEPAFINSNSGATLFSDANYYTSFNNTAIAPPFTGNANSFIAGVNIFTGSPGLTLANNAGLWALNTSGTNVNIMNLDSGNNLNITAVNSNNQMALTASSGHQIRFLNHLSTNAAAYDDTTSNFFFGSNSTPTATAGPNGLALIPLAIASLPACNATSPSTSATGTLGMMRVVNNATAPTYLGALTAGGAVYTPVFCNGTAWVSF
jgi:hypothetical protein